MVARTTPARRAISDMLASGSLANVSVAASRIRATLRSASERRRGEATGGVLWVGDIYSSVDRHTRREPQCWQEPLGGRQEYKRGEAGNGSQDASGQVRVREA